MNLADFDLNLLVAFEALDAERNVTRAAQRLGVRQPAMSASLARLRVLFGDQLFVRSAGQMRPTAKAEQVSTAVYAALSAARDAFGNADSFSTAALGKSFTIASTDYTSLVLMPGLLAAVGQAAPNVDLRIIGYDKDEIPELLADHQVTLALGVFRTAPDRVFRRALCRERFVGVARRDHPALQNGSMSLEAYVDASHALVSVRRDTRGAIDAALARLGLKRRIALTLPHMMALPPILRQGAMIAAVPARAAVRFGDEALQIFELPLSVPEWNVEMLWSPVSAKDKGSAWLRAEVVRAAREV